MKMENDRLKKELGTLSLSMDADNTNWFFFQTDFDSGVSHRGH